MPDGAPNPVDLFVGNKLRQARTLRGLTQEQLGAKVGIAFQQVQKYERGSNRISAGRLFEMAQALGVPVTYFFEGMSDAVAEASPAQVHPGIDTTEAVESIEQDDASKREALQLVRAYCRIGNEGVRRTFLEMVRSFAPASDN
jgi:transcriptional regulator with XRE-family HTH domain